MSLLLSLALLAAQAPLASGPGEADAPKAAAEIQGKVHEYELVVERRTLELSGKPYAALTINGGVPGPVLRFVEGEWARIRVINRLDEMTSMHWHGLLVPNAMDGVGPMTGPMVPAGGELTYEFPLKQAGTFWYHSHAGLQEQLGVYGAIVIDPKVPEADPPDGELVLVLSDWIDGSPRTVMKTLMRGSNWYGIKKGTLPTILGAWNADEERPGSWKAYWNRELARLPPMDLSDVAYDAFLINGKRRLDQPAKPGERWRLRLINAGASSYFYVNSATGPLTIRASDGPAVEPIQVHRLLMAIAETYDVDVVVPEGGAFEIRSSAQDGSGYASLFLGSGPEHAAPALERPDLYRMEQSMLAALLDSRRAAQSDEEALAKEPPRPLGPYKRLRSPAVPATWTAGSTAPMDAPGNAEVRTVELRLTGDMRRYVWSMNGKTLAQETLLPVRRGERLRLVLVNDTMMHHPMHLHGFFFRLIEGQGERSPLKHTVDVPPMGKRVIEFDANALGDWLFHCHLLYHMEAGMTRVVRVSDQPDPRPPRLHGGMLDPYMPITSGVLQTHMTMGTATLMNARNEFGVLWDTGIRHDQHEGDGEQFLDGELDLFWSRYLGPNLSTLLGWRFTSEENAENRAFAGAIYRLPYSVLSRGILDTEGDVRVSLMKEFQLTPRWSISEMIEYDTLRLWENQVQLEYVLSRDWSLVVGHQTRHGFGVGVGFRF